MSYDERRFYNPTEMTTEDLLDVYCYAYYVMCNPLVSDLEFDTLEKSTGKLARFRGNELSTAYPETVKRNYDILRRS